MNFRMRSKRRPPRSLVAIGALALATSAALARETSPVSVPPTGAAGVDETAALRRSDPLRLYCYQGDGASHPLSSVARCGDKNTAGYSLDQWRAVLPAASALSEEVDAAAINSYIRAMGSEAAYLPIFGKAVVNAPIVSCAGDLTVVGMGRGASVTVRANGVTAFQHCANATPPQGASFHMRNLRVLCDDGFSCGDGIDVTLSNSAEPSLLLEDASISVNGSGRWANAAETRGVGGSRIQNSVFVNATQGRYSGDCFKLTSSKPFTVLIQFMAAHFYGCAVAVDVVSEGSGQGVEGINMFAPNADQVIDFFRYTIMGADYNPPLINLYAPQVSFFGSLFSVRAPAGAYVSDWTIRDGWFIQLAPNAQSGTISPPLGLIDLGAARRVILEGCTFTQSAGASMNALITAAPGASDWSIERNYTPILLGAVHRALVNIPDGATNIVERDNDFAYAGTVVDNAAFATLSVASEAYIAQQSNHACYLAASHRRGTIGSRVIKCAASVRLAPTQNAALLTLPAKVFQGVEPPVVTLGPAVADSGQIHLAAIVPHSWRYADGVWSARVETPADAATPYEIHYEATGR